MKKNLPKILLGLLITLLIGSLVYWKANNPTKTYYVHNIQEHSPHNDENSFAQLQVYVNGKAGHTKQLYCYFPPGTEFACQIGTGVYAGHHLNCTGLNKVKTLGVQGKFLSDYAYYCEVVN